MSVTLRLMDAPKRAITPANDNRRTVRMVARNGGCSTTSGMVAVSVPRVSFIDSAEGDGGQQVAA
jgi:hypothetical protein